MATATTQPTRGHFHCLECGSLFEAEICDLKEQRCPVCGNPPSGKILAGTELDRATTSNVARAGTASKTGHQDKHGVNHQAQDIYEATLEAQDKKNKGRVKRSKRREKRSLKVPIFIGVWVILMAGVVVLMNFLSPPEDERAELMKIKEAAEQRHQDALAQKKASNVREAIKPCEESVTAFFNASSPAEKSQYAYQGAKLAGTINRHYRAHTSFSSVRSRVKILLGEWLEIPGKQAMAALCVNNLGDNLEVIFLRENREWKIDWESLVKYNPSSWPLFLSQKEGTTGEFRLYMRIRNLHDGIDASHYSLVFYQPKTYFKKEFKGTASDAVRVPRDGELGKQILKLHEAAQKEKDEFGYTASTIDPDGFIRIRAKMRVAKDKDGKPALALDEILSDNWYGSYMKSEPKSE